MDWPLNTLMQRQENILDILEGRDARKVKDHFTVNYFIKDLQNVETITFDLNEGYVNVINEIFPQGKITINQSH